VIADTEGARLDRDKSNVKGRTKVRGEAIVVADGTAKLAFEAAVQLDAAERRLLAKMPLHPITSVHGEAGLRE
jgi:hypothetical protein